MFVTPGQFSVWGRNCVLKSETSKVAADRQRHWAAGIIGIIAHYIWTWDAVIVILVLVSDWFDSLPFSHRWVSVWCGELMPSQTSLCNEANKAPQNTAAVCRNCLSRQRQPSWLWNLTLKGLWRVKEVELQYNVVRVNAEKVTVDSFQKLGRRKLCSVFVCLFASLSSSLRW